MCQITTLSHPLARQAVLAGRIAPAATPAPGQAQFQVLCQGFLTAET